MDKVKKECANFAIYQWIFVLETLIWLSLGIKYINKDNGAFSDSAVEFGGAGFKKIVPHKGDPLQSSYNNHLGVDHVEN